MKIPGLTTLKRLTQRFLIKPVLSSVKAVGPPIASVTIKPLAAVTIKPVENVMNQVALSILKKAGATALKALLSCLATALTAASGVAGPSDHIASYVWMGLVALFHVLISACVRGIEHLNAKGV